MFQLTQTRADSCAATAAVRGRASSARTRAGTSRGLRVRCRRHLVSPRGRLGRTTAAVLSESRGVHRGIAVWRAWFQWLSVPDSEQSYCLGPTGGCWAASDRAAADRTFRNAHDSRSQLVTRSSAPDSALWSPNAGGVASRVAQLESNGVHLPSLVSANEVGADSRQLRAASSFCNWLLPDKLPPPADYRHRRGA